MTQKHSHSDCKYFYHKSTRCPHINTDIMKRATRLLDHYDGEFTTVPSSPTDKEIDNICNNDCNMFTQK